MPQLPNPNEPGQPGIRGREVEEKTGLSDLPPQGVDRTRPEPDRLRGDENPQTGRQPQHPGQPARYHDKIGQRDEAAER
jgi:hypothetical protein